MTVVTTSAAGFPFLAIEVKRLTGTSGAAGMSQQRNVIFHGIVGAMLGALIAASVQLWVTPVNWIFVAVLAVAGFGYAAFYGERSIRLLGKILWWS